MIYPIPTHLLGWDLYLLYMAKIRKDKLIRLISESIKKALSESYNTNVKEIPGSTTSVEVNIPIVFSDNAHSRTRQNTRGINNDMAISLVKQVLPSILKATVNNKITKTQDGKPFFNVADKQSCAVVGCTMEGTGTNDLKQFITIRTVYFMDQYHTLDTSKTIFFVNENNPSDKWEDAVYYSTQYANSYQQYRNYEKSLDPEHMKEYNKEKRNQMNQMWSQSREKEPDRLGKDYNRADQEVMKNKNLEKQRNGMAVPEYNLNGAASAADNRILTKRGPNGTLRGIDRKRKKANKI